MTDRNLKMLSVEQVIRKTRKSTAVKLRPALMQMKLPTNPLGQGLTETLGGPGAKRDMLVQGLFTYKPPPSVGLNPKEFCSSVRDSLESMNPALKTVIDDDSKQMRLALVIVLVLLALGVAVIAFTVFTGKFDESLFGVVLEGLIVAPYWRYDQARKEKNAYILLVPTMEADLVACQGKPETSDVMQCCADTLNDLNTLRGKLLAIAGTVGSAQPPSQKPSSS